MIDYEEFKKDATKKTATITEAEFVDKAAKIISEQLKETRCIDLAIIQSDIIAKVATAIFERGQI